MTSNGPSQTLPAPQVFTIFSLPSYEDAVKSSGEPPSYEQALTDLRVDNLEIPYGNNFEQTTLPRNRPIQDPDQLRQKACHRRIYKSCCWGLAVIIIFVLGYMIYNGIFRYMTNN